MPYTKIKKMKSNCGKDKLAEVYAGRKMKAKNGLYFNIHAKRERIAEGGGERMRKPGEKGAPTAQQFKEAAKTAKK
jgi:hypothetical protein